MSYGLFVVFKRFTKLDWCTIKPGLSPPVKYFTDHSKAVLLLWIFYVSFSVLCLLCICMRLFICALWSPAGKGLASWLSFVVSGCEFATFPVGILGQMCYLIVLIPDLCTLTYFYCDSLKYICKTIKKCEQNC